MGHSRNRYISDSLFIGCGEASGDHYASLLTGALRSSGFSADIWGMMGDQCVSSGGRAVWSSSSLSLIGVSEVLGALPRLIRLRNEIADEILKREPSGVVVIDSPDFNIPLLKRLKKLGYRGKMFYLAPPTVWAWRQGRADALAELCDMCFPLFGFEKDFLETRGVKCRWFGHPLLNGIRRLSPAKLDDIGGRKVVALLPGSRRSEIRTLLPVLLETAQGVADRGLLPVFSIAPGLDAEVSADLKAACSDWRVFEGPGAELMAGSEMVIGASGTAAVEALILRKFMIVLYRVSLSSWITCKLFVKTPWISIPNILAKGSVYPELLQGDASPGKILRQLDNYIGKTEEKIRIEVLLDRAALELGEGNAPEGWARSIMEILGA